MKLTRRLPFFSIWLLLALLIYPVSGLALTPEEAVTRIQAQYDRSGGFKAYFKQDSRLKGRSQGDLAEGWVYFQKPLKMRWQYEKPAEQQKEIISDGGQVWMYIPQDSVVMVYPLNRVLRSDLVMRFFSGMGQLRQDFNLVWHRPPEDGAALVIDFVPKKPQAELQRLTLTVNPQTYQVENLEFTNALGEETRFAFSRIQLNAKVPSAFFTFTPPPGVQVIKDMPGPG